MEPDQAYLLLTPGPLTTSRGVKEAMLTDRCTWDRDYNDIVNDIRHQLVVLADGGDEYTSVLMQGSGTFSVEATLGSVIPDSGKLLVVSNGAYGKRIAEIAHRLEIAHRVLDRPEFEPVIPAEIESILQSDSSITHVAMVHCETTSGMLNPAQAVGRICQQHNAEFILDAMSSFGGLPMSVRQLAADYLVSSSNKCLQGVPGFGFVIARRSRLQQCQGRARSLSLDLYDQWLEMERGEGKWRYTSPTHTVLAFAQALRELVQEGGVAARTGRYTENHQILVAGMARLGFSTLVAPEHQSPIITSFLNPSDPAFSFQSFYEAIKSKGFVIYPGKVTHAETFRIGTIGHVFPSDVRRLLGAVEQAMEQLQIHA